MGFENAAYTIGLFAVSLMAVHLVSKRNFSKKIVGNDINKHPSPLVAESCGGILIVPIWLLIVLCQLLFGFDLRLIGVGVAITVFAAIGFLDDNRHKFLSKPMGWKERAIPIAITSLLLAGWLFPPVDILGVLLVVLLALFFAGLASFSNTFEGLNGWTVGSSFIITSIIAFAAFSFNTQLGFIYTGLAAIILGLLMFNRYPAKAFPGDSGTLLIGSTIAGLALYSQDILFVIFIFVLFIPHMIDFFLLKMITNRKDASQHKQRPYKLLENGRLTIPEYPDKKEKLDFAKLVMKIHGPLYEWQIVIIIWCFVLANSIFWLLLFKFLQLI
ncbi:MAG: hypothetical protein AABW59_02055 [archaeon]